MTNLFIKSSSVLFEVGLPYKIGDRLVIDDKGVYRVADFTKHTIKDIVAVVIGINDGKITLGIKYDSN